MEVVQNGVVSRKKLLTNAQRLACVAALGKLDTAEMKLSEIVAAILAEVPGANLRANTVHLWLAAIGKPYKKAGKNGGAKSDSIRSEIESLKNRVRALELRVGG